MMSVAGYTPPLRHDASLSTTREARPVTDLIPLCHYGDGNLAAAYITLVWGDIGWCKAHLSAIGSWPAQCFEEMS
jgi:hypothetical protein